MTEKEKLEANEHKRERHTLARGKCFVCNQAFPFEKIHLAHRVPKGYAKIYGSNVINHDDNMPLTCEKCNPKVLLDPKTHPIEARAHLDRIRVKLLNKIEESER